jgi:hypothetical protein
MSCNICECLVDPLGSDVPTRSDCILFGFAGGFDSPAPPPAKIRSTEGPVLSLPCPSLPLVTQGIPLFWGVVLIVGGSRKSVLLRHSRSHVLHAPKSFASAVRSRDSALLGSSRSLAVFVSLLWCGPSPVPGSASACEYLSATSHIRTFG